MSRHDAPENVLQEKKSAEELRRELDQLSDFLENVAVPLHSVSPDGTILWANHAELDALGYARDDYVGRHIAEFHADRPVIEDILARLTRGEELHDYPARLVRKDGSFRHVLISSNACFRDGEFVHTRCSTRDVTEHARLHDALRSREAALRESEERLRFTLNAVRVGTWDWDMRTDKVRWSENLERIHGLEPGSFDGRFESFLEDVLPEDRERVRHALREALEGSGDYHVEYRLHRPPDRTVWVEGRGRVIHDSESGRPVGMTGICTDVTARKAAEETRARLAAIVESSLDAILGKTLEGTITDWNEGAERMYGYSAEEALGSPISILVPPDRLDDLSRISDSLRRGERVEEYETVRRKKDGTAIDVSLTVSPIRDANGTVIGAATIARDITERKRYEAALQRAYLDLKSKNEELEQFVYSVSHDLKSPLVTTLGFLGILKEDLAAGRQDTVRDAMARIERAARRMDRLIDDLLQLSRIGSVRQQPEETDVAALVKEISEDLGPRIRESGAVLRIADDMPRVVTDRAQLSQVFENLLTNALKYGCKGDAAPIEIGGRSDNGKTRYYVRDQGPGIAREYHERVFGLFQRLDSREEGTGIGLTICRRIMEVGGGRLWVESESGRGACFWLEFPAPRT